MTAVDSIKREKLVKKGPPPGSKMTPATTPPGPIAKKLIAKMKKRVNSKVIHLDDVVTGRARSDELVNEITRGTAPQGTGTPGAHPNSHPAHAAYITAQNTFAVVAEQLLELKEAARFAQFISGAEEEYLPEGPPLSPLTRSYFSSWSLFDAGIGIQKETLGQISLAIGKTFGIHEHLLSWMAALQNSRMGIYIQESADGKNIDGKNADGENIFLRELITGNTYPAINPSGYRGVRGELWYVRLLPPPLGGEEHVVFTTPYILTETTESDWLAYLHRTLKNPPANEQAHRYARHLKFGPQRNYWPEFVFEAYRNHQKEAIFLAGLPDVEESRPHSQANR